MTRPLSRCIELRALEHEQRSIARDAFNFRPEYAELFDAATNEADWARAERREVLSRIKLEHLVWFHGKSERQSIPTTTEVNIGEYA